MLFFSSISGYSIRCQRVKQTENNYGYRKQTNSLLILQRTSRCVFETSKAMCHIKSNATTLIFIGPCINVIVENKRPTWCHLLFLFHFLCAQHVSDINISIIRSLRLFCWITTLVVCSWFEVCWCSGVVGLAWYPCCRLSRVHYSHHLPTHPRHCSVLNTINPVHTIPTYFCGIHFNIIITAMSNSTTWLLRLMFF